MSASPSKKKTKKKTAGRRAATKKSTTAKKAPASKKKKKSSRLAKKISSRVSTQPEPEILPAESNLASASGSDPLEGDVIDVTPVGKEAVEASEQSIVAAVSPTDPLRQYLLELQKHPLLEPEEELRLATQMIEHGDMNAARRLVTANLRLVVKIAFEYRSLYTNTMDLIQEGNVGLMKAVSKYDPSKGARLGYYASWWIRSYILKYLLDNFRLVRIGKTQAQKKLFYQLVREKERIEAQGMVAAPKLLAERLDVKEKEVVEMQNRLSSSGSEVSIDAPMRSNDSGSSSFAEVLADHDHESVDETVEREQLLEILRDNLDAFRGTLNDKEKSVLVERILSEAPSTLQQVADEYGLSRERVRQIENKVVQKLREFLKPMFSGEIDSEL
jgi:RNA polymerase sigma-32 factor